MPEGNSNNKTVVITGASGFLGRALVSHFAGAGWSVRAVSRNISPDLLSSVQTFTVNCLITDENASQAFAPFLSGSDTLIHCAGRAHILKETASDPLQAFRILNRDATLNLAENAVQFGVKRFIFISSIGVNGNETVHTPFKASDAPSPHSPYAVSKLEAEQGLQEISHRTGMEVVIIRPPLILGANPKGNLGTLKRIIAKGVPLPFSLVTRNRRDLVSLATLCNLICVCAQHPRANGNIFLVSDGACMNTREILESIARLENLKAVLFPFPPFLLSFLLGILGKTSLRSQLLGNLELDISDTERMLDWKPGSGA